VAEVRSKLATAVETIAGGGREIGPIGTASRVALGALAIGLPIALDAVEVWDVPAALIAFPLVVTAMAALVTAAYERFAPQALTRRHAVCSGPACSLALGMIAFSLALSALTPVSGVAFWMWIGASLLLAAARGYEGCEILAFPNAITGRRDQIGCILLTPIDAAEARRNAGAARWPAPSRR
jgi:hypothetical protein